MKALLIVDLQRQFGNDGKYRSCIDFISENEENYDMIIPMVYSQRVMGDINDQHESDLDNSSNCLYCNESDLEYDTKGSAVIIRNTYKSDYMLEDIPEDCKVDVIGCDDKSGVMANCFALWDSNIDFRILSEYIYTNNSDISVEILSKYMKRHFGRRVA